MSLVFIATVVGALSGALTVVMLAFHGGRMLVRLVRGMFRFLDDWNGEDARPGFPRRPGFPERLTSLEERFGAFEVKLCDVEAQLHPNSGSTLRDAVSRVEQTLAKDQSK